MILKDKYFLSLVDTKQGDGFTILFKNGVHKLILNCKAIYILKNILSFKIVNNKR